MDILFATTELEPYAKVGGLADVSAALPKALRAIGHGVTIVAPKLAVYEDAGLSMARRITPLEVSLGDRKVSLQVFETKLPSQIELILLDDGWFSQQRSPYGEGQDSLTQAVAFATFCRGVAELVVQRRQQGPKGWDVVHGNDWPTALIGTYVSEAEGSRPREERTPFVLSLHNLAHQGVFDKDLLPQLGLPWEYFSIEHMEFYGRLSFLKQGILSAHALTTVSPRYARDIVSSSDGFGLEGVLSGCGKPVTGILNGIDTSVYNPATDPALPARFDPEDISGKARNKGALLRKLHLAIELSLPLVAFVGRFVEQKGVDLLEAALPRLIRATDAQFVIAGHVDPAHAKRFEEKVDLLEGRLAFLPNASDADVHRIFAAADILLTPSRFEPCGLVPMYGQRYGAVPVARATGGLLDSIIDCDADLETGTGFLFDSATPDALVGACARAVSAYRHEAWHHLVRRVMKLEVGWERPARRYEQVYRSVVGG